jgi:hypothetical protein
MNIDPGVCPGTWCIVDAPKQNGDLWVEVTKDQQVKVMNPAGHWWRGKVFATVEDFWKAFKEAK